MSQLREREKERERERERVIERERETEVEPTAALVKRHNQREPGDWQAGPVQWLCSSLPSKTCLR